MNFRAENGQSACNAISGCHSIGKHNDRDFGDVTCHIARNGSFGDNLCRCCG
jgi:hypothetical protein